MNHPDAPRCDNEPVLADIAARAPDVDRGLADLAGDLASLRDAGLLAEVTDACLPGADWRRGFELLMAIGAANLSLGRLVEGHVNAARLICLYGTAQQKAHFLRADQFLGVWGADGVKPLEAAVMSDGKVLLTGGKTFCSGLGLVTTAIVTAPAAKGAPQLLLIEATDTSRHDPDSWQVSGMRATVSGCISLDGMQAQLLGEPDDQLIEPHFEGGVWRYLALHSGGLDALARECAARLSLRAASDMQKARLARLTIAAGTAMLWSRRAAKAAEHDPASLHAVPIVLLAREAVEQACQDGIRNAERLTGTAAFRTGTRIDLIRRDLAFFLRQADLDGKLLRAAETLYAPARNEDAK